MGEKGEAGTAREGMPGHTPPASPDPTSNNSAFTSLIKRQISLEKKKRILRPLQKFENHSSK